MPSCGSDTPKCKSADERRTVYADLRENLRPVCEYGAERGVKVAVEPLVRYETSLVNTVEQALEVIDGLPAEGCGLLLDTYHANIEEKDALGCIDTVHATGKLNHIHISENDRGTPGTGHAPCREAIRKLKGLGYDGWLTIEAFGGALPDLAAATRVWRDFFSSPEEVYTDGYKLIRETWDRAERRC